MIQKKFVLILGLLLLLGLIYLVLRPAKQQEMTTQPQMTAAPTAEAAIAKVAYRCTGNKKVDATYYKDKVSLVLSDGRRMDVPQAMSGSGARYANADESFVFWNKGDTAFIEEGNNMTYQNCIENK